MKPRSKAYSKNSGRQIYYATVYDPPTEQSYKDFKNIYFFTRNKEWTIQTYLINEDTKLPGACCVYEYELKQSDYCNGLCDEKLFKLLDEFSMKKGSHQKYMSEDEDMCVWRKNIFGKNRVWERISEESDYDRKFFVKFRKFLKTKGIIDPVIFTNPSDTHEIKDSIKDMKSSKDYRKLFKLPKNTTIFNCMGAEAGEVILLSKKSLMKDYIIYQRDS